MLFVFFIFFIVFLTIPLFVLFIGILKVIEYLILDKLDTYVRRIIFRIGYIVVNLISGAILNGSLSFGIYIGLSITFFPGYLDAFYPFFVAIFVGAPTGILAGISVTLFRKIWMGYLFSVFLALIFTMGVATLMGVSPFDPFHLILAFITVTITFLLLLLIENISENLLRKYFIILLR